MLRPIPLCRWSWAICTDTCAICRNNLYEPSIEYQANPTGEPWMRQRGKGTGCEGHEQLQAEDGGTANGE